MAGLGLSLLYFVPCELVAVFGLNVGADVLVEIVLIVGGIPT